MYKKVDIAGLKVDQQKKQELLTVIQSRMKANQKTWITTVYSEFLYAALKDTKTLEILNKADLSVPDGIGIFWAHKFLSIPLTSKSYWGKILQAFWQAFYTLAAIIFNPRFIKPKGVDKIPGSELIWDLAKLATKNNFSIYLLGGFGNTPDLVKNNLISKYPNIQISASNKNPEDKSVLDDIKKASPDMLFVAYGPIRQEKWIYENIQNLPVKLVIGLGGTFDYIAGKKPSPPQFLRTIGLEWLWRLITQPYRFKRITNATFGLIMCLIRYKVYMSLTLRPNVVIVILNKENKVLVCQRDPENFHIDIIENELSLKNDNYWQIPQGGIDEKEDLVMAAKREAMEEINVNDLELIKVSEKVHIYYWNNAVRKLWINRKYRHKGQKQNIVYFKLLTTNDTIQVDNHEFINYKWVAINDLDKIVHKERLPLTKLIQEDLKHLA